MATVNGNFSNTSTSGRCRSLLYNGGDGWSYCNSYCRVYSKVYGYTDGNNLLLRPEYFIRMYMAQVYYGGVWYGPGSNASAEISTNGLNAFMDYGSCQSGQSPFDITLRPGNESGNMYNQVASYSTVTSKTTNFTYNCKLRNSGDAYSSVRYCQPFSNTVSYTVSNPTYTVKLGERTPNSISIVVTTTSDTLGLWGYCIYNETKGYWVGGNSANYKTGTTVTDTELDPNTTYTYRIEPWWFDNRFGAGNNTTITGTTLYNPPSGVTINTPTNITHQSFDVSCNYNLNGSILKSITWEISGVFHDNQNHTLTFEGIQSQNFSNINGYRLKPNTRYSIRVKVTNSEGYSSDWSSYAYATTLYELPIINSITVSNVTYQSGYITVNYTTYAPLDNIIIEYKLASASDFTQLQSSKVNSYNLTGLTPNTTYDVKATVSDTQGRYVTSTTRFTTQNDPPEIYSITFTNVNYYSVTVNVSYKLVTEMQSFTYRLLKSDNTVVRTGDANKTFNLSDLEPNTLYKVEVTLTDIYNYSSTKMSTFTTKDDRAIKLVRTTYGTTKHRLWIIQPDGTKTLILPEKLHTK